MGSSIVFYIPRLWVFGLFIFLVSSSAICAEVPSVFRNSQLSASNRSIISTLAYSMSGKKQEPLKKATPLKKKQLIRSSEELSNLSQKEIEKSIYIARFQLSQMDKLYSPGISRSYFVARNNLIERLKKLISIQEGFNG